MNTPGRLPHLLPAVIAAAFGVYASTLSEHSSGDSLRYAASVAADRPGELASAHHPLGGLIAYGLHRVGTLAGLSIEPLRALQLTSSTGGGRAGRSAQLEQLREWGNPAQPMGELLLVRGLPG